jgi:hypothetical protein
MEKTCGSELDSAEGTHLCAFGSVFPELLLFFFGELGHVACCGELEEEMIEVYRKGLDLKVCWVIAMRNSLVVS